RRKHSPLDLREIGRLDAHASGDLAQREAPVLRLPRFPRLAKMLAKRRVRGVGFHGQARFLVIIFIVDQPCTLPCILYYTLNAYATAEQAASPVCRPQDA